MMTELEEQLARPGAESLRLDLSRRLDALAEHTRLRLAEGVPKKDYALWQKAGEAIQAASDVVACWPIPQRSDISSEATSPRGEASHLPRRA